MGCTELLERIGDRREAYTVLVGKLKERRPLDDPGVDGG
jgi:hypothetical protein